MVTINKMKSCRTCLEDCEEVTTTIYDKIKRTMSTTIVELLRDFTFIKVSDFEDQLPLSICNNCLQMIKSCYEFKLLCQKSENIILQQLNDNSQNQEPELIIKSEPISQDLPDSNVSWVDEMENFNTNENLQSEPFIKIEELKHELILETEDENNEFDSYNYENKSEFNIDSDQLESNGPDPHNEYFTIDPTKENRMVKQSNQILRKILPNEENRTICLVCNSEFKSDKLFYRHAKLKHKKQRVFKSKTYTVDSIHLREVYYCIKCKKVINNRREFVDHIIFTHKKEPYECFECNAILEHSYAYRNHLLECYKEEIVCNICNIRFDHRDEYKIHKEKMKHEDENFLCPYCGCIKNCHSNYNSHIRIHTGEKPYACDHCDKTFTDWSSLKTHKACVHSDERNYVCSQCGAGFKTTSSLYLHLRIHSGEKKLECTICGLKFLRQTHLKRHYLVHSDERKEVCTYCNKSYKRKSGLNIHMKIHTGKNMHLCPICDKPFTQRVLLKRHMKKHQADGVK